MKSGRGLTLCLIGMLLTLSTTPVMCNELSTMELWKLLDEAEVVIVELMEENLELQSELEGSWKSCAVIIEETATKAVAVAVKPLLIEMAGLKAERDVLRTRVVLFGIGGILTGVVAGVIIGVLL